MRFFYGCVLFSADSAIEERPGSSDRRECPGRVRGVMLEGWQKFWEQPPESAQALGIAPANIKWLKTNETYGLFERASKYKNVRGERAERKLFKEKMEFHPPPPPMAVKGAVPNMLSFFRRPVGVMKALIRCPNTNCPAPPEYYLEKRGYGSYARQVCGMNFHYTLLTERLMCKHCLKLREEQSQAHVADSDDGEDGAHQQYTWLAYSPKILMNLAPAIRSIFLAIICGKRAVDRSVVTLMSDRLNAVSMSKVQRLLQQGHDEWYVERRDLYQTLLYDAYTSAAGSSSSQRGILSFDRAAGTYTPPIALSPLPSARVLRRAHLILEMEKAQELPGTMHPTALSGEVSPSAVPLPRSWPCLLHGSEGQDRLGVHVGQWNGETAEDGVFSDSVCNPLILSLQRSRDLAGGGELIGRCSVLQHLEEEVEQATVLGHLCRLSVSHTDKLGLLGCSGLGRVRPKNLCLLVDALELPHVQAQRLPAMTTSDTERCHAMVPLRGKGHQVYLKHISILTVIVYNVYK